MMPPLINKKSQNLLPIWGILFGAIFWVIDSVIDILIFEEDSSFSNSLFTPEPVEFWMRLLVVIMLLLFAFYAKYMLGRQYKILEELNQFKHHLEHLVDERTQELEISNQQLNNEIIERKNAQEELERLATTDPLTKLFNRRKFEELLNYEMERDKRYRTGLSFVFCDIDRFKQINDNIGHDVGDSVLSAFAQILKQNIRKSDVVARWGGEEFVLLIPNMSADTAKLLTEKLRKLIANYDFPTVGSVTVSFGVTHLLGDDNQNEVIKRADEALYKAKENGRNTVVVLLE